jgi:nitrogenase iron protein NifH
LTMEREQKETLRLAIYGKGGIGKSFVSANLSVLFAKAHKVIHVGCDPKGDSTRNLAAGNPPEPALDKLLKMQAGPASVRDLLTAGIAGVDCVEAGGPEPGEGCGGMGILKLFQFLTRTGFFKDSPYSIQLFDVLGDVVCGGFVAPMRFATPLTVLVVVSEEVHSLYAANQVAKAVRRYAESGVSLAGLVLNRRDNRSEMEHVHRFAAALGTTVLAELPRTPEVFDADLARLPVVVKEPASLLTAEFHQLKARILDFDPGQSSAVTPLDAVRFDLLLSPTGRS